MEDTKTGKVVYINSCSYCGKTLKEEWKFCPYCKITLETFQCIFCGQEVKSNWNYCPNCKNEIKIEHKNKQRVDKCNEWLRNILKK